MRSSIPLSISRRDVVVLVAAFAAGAVAPGSVLAQGGKPPVKMRITVSTHPLLDFSVPVFVGIEQGFFQREGVVVEEVVSSEGGGTTVRNILTGGLDMGLVSFPAAIQANLAGAALKVVEGGERLVTTHTLVVPENSKINSLKEAVDQGATIGYSSAGAVTQALLVLNLQRMGIDATKVKTRATGGLGAGFTAARGGGIEVTSAIEPVLSVSGKGLRVIHRHSDHVKKFQQMVWVVNPKFAETHPDGVAGFLRARIAAINWIDANLEQAAALWAAKADIAPAAALATLKTVAASGGIKAYYGTGFDQEAMETAVQTMRILGTLKPDVSIAWTDILDQSKLPKETPRVDVSKFSSAGK
jgi:NitT/TauT family transport system substrate-binding protein